MKKFNETMLKPGERVIVAFKAPWCKPCNTLTPVLEDISKYCVPIYEVNIDEQRQMAVNYGVKTIPTLIIFNDGKIEDIITGISDASYEEVTARLMR